METILRRVKIDLGISHNKKDADYFVPMIAGVISELKSKGIDVDLDDVNQAELVKDIVVWRHNHKVDGAELPKFIEQKIINLKMVVRSK